MSGGPFPAPIVTGILLVVSLAAQLGAVAVAVRMIRATGKWRAWLILAAALGLMAARRAMALADVVSASGDGRVNVLQEALGLVISLAILWAVGWMGSVFLRGQADAREMRRLADELRLHRDQLEAQMAERTRRLRETEESFRALAENSVDVIMRFDRRHRHLYANPMVEKQTGIPARDFLGKTHHELGFPSELVEFWEEAIETVFLTGAPHRVEFQLPTGVWIDWLLVPELAADGSVATVITTARDVTARKRIEEELSRHRDRLEELVAARTAELEKEIADRVRAEQELRASEERFRSLYNNVHIGLYRTTPEGRVLMANPALVRMLGLPSFEALAEIDLEAQSWYVDFDRAAFRERVEREGAIHGLEARWRRSDGSTLVVRESARAVRDNQDRVLYYEGTVEDVTGHHALEKQLRQAQRIEALGQLAGGIAHDFNNLLMAIQGSADLLRRRIAGYERTGELDTILESVARGGELTRSLLTFARRQVLQRRPVDLNEVVEALLPVLRRVIPENISVQFRRHESAAAVEADRGGLDQALMNLAVNARDAMPDGGTLTVETTRVNLDENAVAGYPRVRPGEFFRLSVRDTGVGIAPDVRPYLFEPFFTTKAPGHGTGLGLATVHGIVTQHGGFVQVDGEPGEGAVFELYFPVSRNLPESIELRPATTPVAGGSETILVVEDEPEVRHVLVQALVELGYRVIAADDGEEALSLMRAGQTVDLVVSDVIMPRMGGRELFRESRRLASPPRFVFSSGYTEVAFDPEIQAGAGSAFLSKPYSIEQLAETVRRVLDAENLEERGSPPEPGSDGRG